MFSSSFFVACLWIKERVFQPLFYMLLASECTAYLILFIATLPTQPPSPTQPLLAFFSLPSFSLLTVLTFIQHAAPAKQWMSWPLHTPSSAGFPCPPFCLVLLSIYQQCFKVSLLKKCHDLLLMKVRHLWRGCAAASCSWTPLTPSEARVISISSHTCLLSRKICQKKSVGLKVPINALVRGTEKKM